MTMDKLHQGWPLFLMISLIFTGCQEPVDPQILAEREKYLLQEEPDGAVGVLEVREKLAETDQPIVLMGLVGAGSDSTWEPGKAKFVIRDRSAPVEKHADTPGHDPSTCPFCKAKKEKMPDMTALIQVVDPDGKVVDVDARKLLALKEEQFVVIRGVAEVNTLGHLVVSADGVYVRQ
ncbi:MAG: hypothetical protein CMJ77_02925 [Planctomycetaceae bacterium]|nr:hypothetical protein [Planctomycetaceae bacterium]